MTHFADNIIGHYEKHALAWEADCRNSGWNDNIWPGKYQTLIEEAGFETVDQVVEAARAGGRTVWLCRSR